MSKVWEPIGYIGFIPDTLLYVNDHGNGIQRLSIGTGSPPEVSLPDDIRLCRLVDAPEVHTAQITSWQEPDPDIYGKRTATIAEGRLWIETEYDSLSIGIPEGLQIVKREP